MNKFNTKLIVSLTLFLACSGFLHAQVTLPALVSDSMVLQRNIPLKIWGWATPGEKVTVKFNKQKAQATTDINGRWSIGLSAMKEGGPYEMQIKGSNEITLKEILIGDVWLCSGQSNMEFPMSRIQYKYAEDVAKSANYPIREFHVKERYSYRPEEKAEGSWKPANPTNILKFSAVGYFFAKRLYDTYKVPIGVLHSSWPGTPAESWISIDSLKQFPEYTQAAKQYANTKYTDSVVTAEKLLVENWHKKAASNDIGIPGKWAEKTADESWLPLTMPGYWHYQGAKDVHGVVWLKYNIQVPKGFVNDKMVIELGMIDDMDSTYVNGRFVGSVNSVYNPRRYPVPRTFLKEGNNELTVRVVNIDGNGGIIPGKVYRLTNGTENISLAGKWVYKIGYATAPVATQNFLRIAYKPTYVYNGLIEPILNYRIKGAVWYQGEGNTGYAKAREYRKLLPVMINEWRAKWKQGNFPFLIVQLANYMQPNPQPGESNWAMLRESQAVVAKTEPNCGLAVAIDIGEANDIHPFNKKDVGYRLSLIADKIAYNNQNVIVSGPVYRSMEKQGNKIVLSFDSIAGGLVAKNGGVPKQFAIAGEDKKFVWADAVIEGDKIVVSSVNVQNPVAVRYAWADNPDTANLYNKEGLPAVPFRTDKW